MNFLAILSLVLLAAAAVAMSGMLQRFGANGRAGESLRKLLLDRASGEIGQEEFEQRQAALHAALALPATAPVRQRLVWALPLAMGALVAGILALRGETPPAEADLPMTAPMLETIAKREPGNKMSGQGGDLKTLVKPLADKLAKDPGNGEGWLLLARTHAELRQFAEADAAFAKAAALLPAEAGFLAEWTDAHVLANQRKWDDKARDIVRKALAANPRDLKALSLAGSEAYARGDYKAAIEFWKRMQAAAPAGSMDAKLAEANIQEATGLMAGKPGR